MPLHTLLVRALAPIALASCGRDGGRAAEDTAGPAAHGARSEAAPVFAPAWSAPAAPDAEGACVDCHARIARDWSRTGMARSLGPVSSEELRGLGPLADVPAGYQYAFQAPGGPPGPSIVETRPDDPQHRLDAPLVFAIGSGTRDRAYAALLGETVWFAPLEVVTSADRRRHSALAPGHTIRPGSRFSVAVTPECTGCHTDAASPPRFPLNLWSTDSRAAPRGISCAACHGPVDRHARLHQERIAAGDPALAAGADPVVNSAHLSRVQRLSICAACHLQGDARILLDPRTLGPPPPGGDVLQERAVFVAAEPDQDVGFVSQVERLVLSRCFLESDALDCTTCHDPHRTLHDDVERARVRAACSTCHPSETDGASSAMAAACGAPTSMRAADGRDCAGCHMRFTPVFDVAEVRIHDHFIRRDPGRPSPASPPARLRSPEDERGDWVRFTWPGSEPPEHVDDPGLWMMAWYSGGHVERALPMIDRAPTGRVSALPMYHHVRASLLEQAGRGEDARAAYETALALDPFFGPSATNLGLLLNGLGRPEEALRVLDQLLERFPTADGALRNRALVQHARGDLAAAARDLEAAYAVVPRPEVAGALASLAHAAGDATAAHAWLDAARRLDPLGRAAAPTRSR